MSVSIHYAACGALFLLGLHGLLYRPNLLRKLMALNVLQASVVLFYVVLAYKRGAAPPVAGVEAAAAAFINPLPHALMLTAIVVGAATTGVGLALLIRIHRLFGTLQESEIQAKTGLS